MNLDDELYSAVKKDVSMLVPWYLTSSYMYYIEDKNFISDHAYDWLCRQMLKHWDYISHWHKSLVPKEDLSAWTGFSIKEEDYPSRIVSAAHLKYNELLEKQKGLKK